MKKNLCILVLVSVVAFTGSLFSFANESKKELDTKREIILKGKRGPEVISELPLLLFKYTPPVSTDLVTAFVEEENFVTLYFNSAVEDDCVLILISDESGNILFEASIIVDQAMEIPIPVELDESNEYKLEIYSATIDLVGEF